MEITESLKETIIWAPISHQFSRAIKKKEEKWSMLAVNFIGCNKVSNKIYV